MQNFFLLVADGHPMSRRYHAVDDWPWTWLRVMSHVKHVKNIYQQVALDKDPKTAMPPKWMWFMYDRVEAWFKERRDRTDD